MASIQINITNRWDIIWTWPVMVYRKRRFGYSFRRIWLGEGIWAIVDAIDYYRLGHFKWYLHGYNSKCYALRNIRIGPMKTKIVSMHREIMNAPKGLVVDHINGNGIDNRRANLRLATYSQNIINRPKTKSNASSRFVGVCFDKSRGKWIAKINYEGKTVWLGRFDSEIEAARVYDEAAKKYHGEFARFNFPEEPVVSLARSKDTVKAP